MSDTDNSNVMSQAEFARRRGVSRATVTEYKQKGLLVMTEEGKVNVKASEERLTASLDPVRGGNRKAGTEKKPSATNNEYMAAKVRETQAKAARAEMENAERAGRLCDAPEAGRTAFTLARATQEAMRGIPDRIASLLAVETDPAKVHAMLSEEIRLACNTLADNVAKEFGVHAD